MTINIVKQQNINIKRSVFGLLAIVLTVFLFLFLVLQFHNREVTHLNILLNNYHLATNNSSLKLLAVIDNTKIWFRDKEIELQEKNTSHQGDLLHPMQLRHIERDKAYILKHEIDYIVKEILTWQSIYDGDNFKSVCFSLQQASIQVPKNLNNMLSKASYSNYKNIDAIVLPLTISLRQLQRLHQTSYEQINLSLIEIQEQKRSQIIVLIFLLALIGLTATISMLNYLYRTLNALELTQNALQLEHNFSTNLVNTAQVIILLLDTKGCIEYVNPYFEQLTGFKLKEIKGKDWLSHFLPQQEQSLELQPKVIITYFKQVRQK